MKKIIFILSTTEKVFIWKSNSKSLSNCNMNFRGQPSVWIGWLLPSCTVCTYPAPIKRNLDKKRSSLIIILLYSVWYCVRFQAPIIKNSIFRPWRWYCRYRLSYLQARYEPYINQYLIYRHWVNFWINCVLVLHLFAMILLVQAHLTFIKNKKIKYFLQVRPSESAVSA